MEEQRHFPYWWLDRYVCNKRNTSVVTSGAGTAYRWGTPEFASENQQSCLW